MSRSRKFERTPSTSLKSTIAEWVNRGVPGRPWGGLYIGETRASDGSIWPRFAGAESTVLVVGPPRSGKTSRLVIPSVLDAPAAVVSTSTKPDVLEATAFRRYALGNCY